jgi:hypothetical protein
MVKNFLKLRRESKLIVSVFFTAVLLLGIGAFFAFAIDTNFSNENPAKSATINISNPKISVHVKSTSTKSLNDKSLVMKVNGTPVNANFQFTGSWVFDEETETTSWVPSDYTSGTVSFNSSNLKDGVNTVDISISDYAGNTLNDSWTFTVAELPTISNISPANNSEQVKVSQISATINDNTAIDWSTVKLNVNGTYIDSSKLIMDQSNGTISYPNNFADGTYSVSLEAKDTSGNYKSQAWSFVADSAPPDLTGLNYFKDGMNILDGNLNFSAALKDLTDINDNVLLSLDGKALNSTLKYKGFTNYYGDYVITSKKQAVLSYQGIVPNGSHSLSLYTEDKLGNKITRQWNFTVSAKPTISEVAPFKYGVQDLKPVISAVVKSPNGTIPDDSIVLKLDGEVVSHSYNESTGIVSYTPTEDLESEQYHTVNLTVNNGTDLAVTKEWKFYTNTYPDMPDSSIENCLTCHKINSTYSSNKNYEDIHRDKLRFSGTHSDNDCDKCHNYISIPANCQQCHDASDPVNGTQIFPHGSTPTIKYQPKNFDPSMPPRVLENREMWDCIVCHQPGSKIGGGTVPSHDIPEIHKSTGDASCNTCHAKSLTREHARDGRTDQGGNPITCNTCHKSTDPKVVKAISDKNTACSACHSDLTHEVLHTAPLEDNCSGCHNKALSTEHVKRGKTCDTCHKSTDPKVITAIANNDKTCSACHENPGHEGNHDACTKCHAEGSSYNK